MADLNLNFDIDNKQINLGSDTVKDTGINLSNIASPNNDELMLGVELLANQEKSVEKPNTPSPKPVIQETIPKNENYDFFDKPSEDTKKIEVPVNDPLINQAKEEQSSDYKPIHEMNGQEIKNEKIDLIYKFKKLEGQGIRTTMNYNMNSQLDDMRNEYLKLKKQREIDNSVKFQRKVMMAAITGLEFLNNKFDPFDVKLDGWSESVNENINAVRLIQKFVLYVIIYSQASEFTKTILCGGAPLRNNLQL